MAAKFRFAAVPFFLSFKRNRGKIFPCSLFMFDPDVFCLIKKDIFFSVFRKNSSNFQIAPQAGAGPYFLARRKYAKTCQRLCLWEPRFPEARGNAPLNRTTTHSLKGAARRCPAARS